MLRIAVLKLSGDSTWQLEFWKDFSLTICTMTHKFQKVPSDQPAPFFQSHIKPHKPITTQRMAHWIKNLQKDTGLNTNMFMVYSVREHLLQQP